MNRNQAIKWLDQVKPLLSHETRDAIDVVVNVSPCDVCKHNQRSAGDGYVCRDCPAERREG